jgi:hypothetical protein
MRKMTGDERLARWNRYTARSVTSTRMIATRMPAGKASSAVGKGPNETPRLCSHQVNRIVAMVPMAMVSPWAKLENRRMP